MRVIWKEPLVFRQDDYAYGVCSVQLPASAEILSVAEQRGQICVWFSVSKDNAEETWEATTFVLVPTGGDLPPSSGRPLRHLGTVLQDEGMFVWHIFLL